MLTEAPSRAPLVVREQTSMICGTAQSAAMADPARTSTAHSDFVRLLSTLHTSDLKALAVAAIDLIDDREVDCDLEDDDPAGDPLDENGEHPTDEGYPLAHIKPAYAADQTGGPINHRDACAAFRAAELGLTRTGRGTWAAQS